ncbi:GatB/YqeY domain-containing protein [Candidatus Parcubacteria bacterium]|nr:MAG: GatB/YqeY domain-containing protein [Candidatus Parcubacteria bacterium]
MTLKEKIKGEFKEAFKAKEEVKLSVLKMVNAEIGNAEINKRAKLMKAGETVDVDSKAVLNDEEVIEVISREAKKRKDSADAFEKAGRPELAEREKAELAILMSYMPEQLSEEKVRELVKTAVEQSGAKGEKEIGKVMAVLMPQVKGKADGALVNKIVREFLK